MERQCTTDRHGKPQPHWRGAYSGTVQILLLSVVFFLKPQTPTHCQIYPEIDALCCKPAEEESFCVDGVLNCES